MNIHFCSRYEPSPPPLWTALKEGVMKLHWEPARPHTPSPFVPARGPAVGLHGPKTLRPSTEPSATA